MNTDINTSLPATADGFTHSRRHFDQTHAYANYLLDHKNVSIPSLEEIENVVKAGVTSETLKRELEILEREHEANLKRLYDRHAALYLDEMKMAYHSNDPDPKDEELKKDISSHLTRTQPSLIHQLDDELARCRHTILSTSLSLKARIQTLEKQEAEAELQRRRQFPTSFEDYKTKDPEIRVRVGRFLIAPAGGRERESAMDRNGWAYRQVEPLLEEYKKNSEFMSTVSADVLSAKMIKDDLSAGLYRQAAAQAPKESPKEPPKMPRSDRPRFPLPNPWAKST